MTLIVPGSTIIIGIEETQSLTHKPIHSHTEVVVGPDRVAFQLRQREWFLVAKALAILCVGRVAGLEVSKGVILRSNIDEVWMQTVVGRFEVEYSLGAQLTCLQQFEFEAFLTSMKKKGRHQSRGLFCSFMEANF